MLPPFPSLVFSTQQPEGASEPRVRSFYSPAQNRPMASGHSRNAIWNFTVSHVICLPLPQTALHNLSCSSSSCTGLSSLFPELANFAHAPGPLHCCFLCLAHSLLRYPHAPLFHLLQVSAPMSEKSYLVIPSKIPTLGLSSLTLLGSLWSISSDILYSIIYGLFPQLEGQCVQGGGSCCAFFFFGH